MWEHLMMSIQFFSSVIFVIYFLCSHFPLSENSLWVKYKMTDIKMKSILIIQKSMHGWQKIRMPLECSVTGRKSYNAAWILSNNGVNYNTPLRAINLQTKTLNKETQRKLLRWHNVYCWNFTAGPILNLFN